MDDVSLLGSAGRKARMAAMWRKAHGEIAAAHGNDGPAWGELFRYAPGLSDRVRWAEQDAEAASLDWAARGGGGDPDGDQHMARSVDRGHQPGP